MTSAFPSFRQGIDGPGGRTVECRRATGLRKETALEGEITDHVGYDKHDPAGKNNGNSRNGTRARTVLTDVGPAKVGCPRCRRHLRAQIVKKRQRRPSGAGEMVLSLSTKVMDGMARMAGPAA